MAGNVVSIEVLADVRKLVSGVGETNKHLGSIEGMAGKAGQAIMAGLAGGAVIAAIKTATDAIGGLVSGASDLQQNMGGAQAIFGDAFGEIERSATGAAEAVGLSKSEYLKMSSTLGAGLKNSGIDDFTGMTEKLITKAADLSAQFGGSSADAVSALGAAYRGEYDSLEKYGIAMKQSDVDARLASRGQDKLTGSAKKAAEAQAKYDIIMEQTSTSTGQFAKENNTLAGQQERLRAKFENTKDQLGTAFLPMLTKVASAFSDDIMPKIQQFIDWIGPKIQEGLDSLGPIIDTVRLFIGSITGEGANVDLPFMNDIIDAGASVRTAFDDIKGAWDKFIQGFTGGDSAGTQMAGMFDPVIDAGTKFRGVFDDAKSAISNLWNSVQEAVAIITPIFNQLVEGIMAKITPMMPTITGIFTSIASIVTSAIDIIASVIHLVMGGIQVFWNEWGGTITAYVSNAMGMIINIFGAAFDFIAGIFKAVSLALKGDWQGALNALTDGANSAWTKIKQAFNDGIAAVWAVISGIGTKIAEALNAAAADAKRIAGNIIDGFVGGISNGLGQIGQAARDMASRLWTEFKSSLGINSPSRVFADLAAGTIEGAVLGINRNLGALGDAGSLMGDVLSAAFTPELTVPQAKLNGYGASGSYSGSGNTYVTVNVSVPATANQVEIGREINNALNTYYAVNGGRA